MTSRQTLRAAVAVLPSFFALSQATFAAPEDFEFRLVDDEIAQSNEAVVAVALVDKRSGTAVKDAVIFATKMDMEPDGMEAMASPVEALPTREAGVYRFKTNLTMAGRWRFSVAAKVQGEAGTVEGRLVFRAVP